jgi:phosphatidylinositol-3-phosphatase
VPLTQLSNDLMHLATTPNYVFITANLCHDGHDSPCVDAEPGGLVSADAFLRQWVPQILASPAYQRDGMLLILFDEAELSGSNADATACCNEIPGPNSPLPGIVGPGGGRVGAVVLSKYVRPGTVVTTPYNHYSLLRTIEDLFGLDHLGFAGQAGANSFGLDVFIAVP